MIVCCGEALIDMIPVKGENGADYYAPTVGGAVFNTTIALGRMGEKTGFISGISTDLFGQQLCEALKGSSVDMSRLVFSDRPTTLAFVKLIDGEARYAFFDENTAGRMLTPEDLSQDVSGVQALFFGGISLVVEPSATAYEALMLQHKDQHVTMVDPNIRPAFIADENGFRARLARMVAAADLVKLSDEDLDWWQGSHGDAAAQNVLSLGARYLVVTRGAEGADLYRDGFKVSVPADKVSVVDTVGAGDTFNAGFLHALSERGLLQSKSHLAEASEAALSEAVAFGVLLAGKVVQQQGANPPWKHEVS